MLDWITLITWAAIIAVDGAILWATAHVAGRADDRANACDEFTTSMQQFGYVQDARNRGEI